MDGVTLLREARAAGLRVRSEGALLVVEGPRRLELLALALTSAKPAVLAALGRCVRCQAEGMRVDVTGTRWCREDDGRRALIDLASLAGWPRLCLTPLLLVAGGSAAAWGEYAASVAGANIGVAWRHVRAHLRMEHDLADDAIDGAVVAPDAGWHSLWQA